MKKHFEPTTITHDGKAEDLRIQRGLVLVRVDLKEHRTFFGIEVAKTWADLSPDYAGRHGVVVASGTDIPTGVTVYFSYMSALGCDRIVTSDGLHFILKREYLYLMLNDGIQMLNGYLLAETIVDDHTLLVQYDQKSFWAKVLHAGETDRDNANPQIQAGDVVMYRMALEVKLEGLKETMGRDYRVLQRAFCVIRKRHD